jgi:hypothetical protein
VPDVARYKGSKFKVQSWLCGLTLNFQLFKP